MKKILLINEGGLGNLGDEAIRCVLERLLKDAGCEVDWARFSGGKKSKATVAVTVEGNFSRFGEKLVRKVLPTELRWLLKTGISFLKYFRANEYELVLIGGGQLIQSNGVFGMAMFIWVYLFKKIHKKRVILIGVGVVGKYSRFEKFLYRKSLQNVDDIYVRDKDSASVLKEIFDVSARLIPDFAFYINKVYKQLPKKEKIALFCPVGYEFYKQKNNRPDVFLNKNEYLHYWLNQVLKYSNKGFLLKLLYTSSAQDLPFVKNLKQILIVRNGLEIEIIDVSTLEKLIEEIAKSEVIVSARMHPLIIGYSYGCKLVPFRTSEKIEAFEKEYMNTDRPLNKIQICIVNSIREAVWSEASI